MVSLFRRIGKYLITEQYVQRFYTTEVLPRTTFAVAKRTDENNPTNHSQEHLGLLYTIPVSAHNSLFKLGGFPKSYQANINTFGEVSLMIRSPAVELINNLKKADYNRPAIRYVLYGKQGCGKSLTLAHVLHYAYENNFIILHVPWVWDWFRNERHEVVYSTTNEGCVDLPILSGQWLKHFQLQNHKILSELDLRISKNYVWNQRENTPAGSPFLDLVTHGINRTKYAADCILGIISELKIHSRDKKCKMLIAIDGFNALFGDFTNLKTEDRTKVKPSMVTLTKAFLDATKQDWTNGAIVVTVDQLSAKFNTLQSHLPLFLLQRKGFEHMDPFVPISVTEYNDMELNSILDYYEDRRWLQKTGGRSELSFLSKNNPYLLMKICGAY